jgi:hypothetical protein
MWGTSLCSSAGRCGGCIRNPDMYAELHHWSPCSVDGPGAWHGRCAIIDRALCLACPVFAATSWPYSHLLPPTRGDVDVSLLSHRSGRCNTVSWEARRAACLQSTFLGESLLLAARRGSPWPDVPAPPRLDGDPRESQTIWAEPRRWARRHESPRMRRPVFAGRARAAG